MYQKQGRLVNRNESDKVFLETISGKVYQVTFIVAHIWKKLDGKTSLDSINKDIQNLAKEDGDNSSLNTISQEVVKQLLPVELVREIKQEAISHH